MCDLDRDDPYASPVAADVDGPSLGPDGQYTTSTKSRSFPSLPVDQIGGFLQQMPQAEENALVRQFRQWVRQQRGSGVNAA